MNLNKHLDFFNPTKIKHEIHLIGVGAIGSNVLNQLVRLGLTNIHIYDFDTVSEHNITNQLYTRQDIDKLKVDAITEHMLAINNDVIITKHKDGWKEDTILNGIVITTVDSIKTRKQIFEKNRNNFQIVFALDLRIGLEEGQMYAANWKKSDEVTNLIDSMQFDSSEVAHAVSACGTTLSVLPTIQMIVSCGVMNLLVFLKQKKHNTFTIVNSMEGVAKSY